MPKNTENFNKELEGFLRGCGFNKLTTLDASGEAVPDASEADQFVFNYKNGPYDYGTVSITTNGGKVTVYYNDAAVRGGDQDIDSNWTKFLKKLKDWSLRYGQMGFSVQNIDKLGADMMKRKQQKREEKLLEGWYGNKHTSWSDNTPTVKMVIKHNKSLDETDQRYHHIEKIFLENSLGERILVPSRKPSVGRAFARHLAEGGQYNDDRWNHIKELAEDVSKLGGFVRATRNRQFNEGIDTIVTGAAEHYQKLRETIRKLSGSRGYNSYFESWQPTLMEEGGGDLGHMFVSNSLDPRIERALPVLNKLKINGVEMAEALEFEGWAENIVETITSDSSKKIGELTDILKTSDELPVGADALSIKGQLEEVITDEANRTELFSDLDELAKSDPDNDAKPAILAWLQKNKNDEFCGKVLSNIQGEDTGEQPAAEPPVSVEPTQAAAPEPAPATPPQPGAAAPQPMAEDQMEMEAKQKQQQQKPRNFVAKHAQRSGAGAHTKPGYQRHDKHKKKLGEELDEVVESTSDEIIRIKELSGLV